MSHDLVPDEVRVEGGRGIAIGRNFSNYYKGKDYAD